jgi:UDP:flavonoid glycosyltransferase YjiC (YdhE family)
MFSRLLGAPQADWPNAVRVTGAVRFDDGEAGLSPELDRFLQAGEPPLVFTLGSAAVGAAGRFFDESARAAMALGRRAVLVAGPYAENRPRFALPPEIMVTDYAPYSALFPRAAIVVHQAGIGTTHQALASGRPQIAVPFAHDQPDNAYRLERIGVARTIRPGAYRAARVERVLASLLEDGDAEWRARNAGDVVRSENGAARAADAIEETFLPATRAAAAS